jgi:hypothetical protein
MVLGREHWNHSFILISRTCSFWHILWNTSAWERGIDMRAAYKVGAAGFIFAYFVACAPVKFDSSPAPSCGGTGVACIQKCTGTSCIQSYSTEKIVGKNPVDILIVDDNSGSMSPDQNKMATAFDGFLSQLESAQLNYKIAVTTTDISSAYTSTPTGVHNNPGPYNGNGALQDGNLIDFGNGANVLTDSVTNRASLFSNTIQRQETIHCEQSGYKECPSDDERGIFAANLALDKSTDSYVRPTAHFALIILSNEDERGLSSPNAGSDANSNALRAMYPLETNDLPETFVSKFRTKYPGKTLSVHSIIVKPGDQTCLQSESNPSQFLIAKEGYSYQKLSQLTGGVIGSICDSNYTQQLKAIGDNIESQALSMPFSCRPINDKYQLSVSPQPAHPLDATADWTKMQLTISGTVAASTTLKLSYQCATGN